MSFEYTPETANEFVTTEDFLPAGEYRVMITSIEDLMTKNGTGNYLKMEMTVVEGPYQNFIICDRFNYRNQNAKAQEIAWKTLKRLARIVFGSEDVRYKPEDLLMKEITISTVLEDDGTYINPRVKAYILPKPAENRGQAPFGATPQQQAPRAMQQQPAQHPAMPPATLGYNLPPPPTEQQQQAPQPAPTAARRGRPPAQSQQQGQTNNQNFEDVPF